MDNAWKYTEKGQIILTIESKEIEESNSEVLIYFTVEDTGCGIKEKAIPSIFDSFQRLELRKHADIQGTGLGLAISKKLVESMGGEISVESVYGEGTKFTFFVKQRIWDPAPMGKLMQQKAEKEDDYNKKTFVAPDARILCVDDNFTNRKVIKELLSLYKIRADVAASGAECLEILRTDSSYHLIFMDYMMPEMDGIETVKKMNKSIPGISRIPVVALTADAVVGVKELLLGSGFKDYVAKPVELPELEKILIQYLPKEIVTFVGSKKEEKDNNMKISIPDVDVNAALSRYGGDRERYLKALSYLEEDGGKQLVRMKDMLNKKDYEGFGCEAHAVKGLTLGVGANKVSDLAKGEEFAVKEGRFDDVNETAEVFFNEYELLLANIRLALKESGFTASSDTDGENEISDENGTDASNLRELSDEERKSRLNEITEALDLLDQSNAERGIKELLNTKIEESAKKELKSALNDVKEFEYEKARKIIILLQK